MHPWEKDLEAAFPDPEQRASVSAFLAGKVQPYVTRVEQQYAETEAARELHDALNGEQSAAAFMQIANALFGEDGAEAVYTALTAEDEPTPAAAEPEAATPGTPIAADEPLDLDKLPLEVRAAVDDYRARKAEEHYRADLERIKGKLGEGDELDEDEFALSVIAAEGDVDQAYEHYQQRMAKFRPSKEETVEETPKAPDVLGTQPGAGGGTADAPVIEKYDSLDDAFDAYFAEQQASAPTPVGAV